MNVLLLAVFGLSVAFGQKTTSASSWHAGDVVDATLVARKGMDSWFSEQAIPDDVFARMKGKSYPADCTVPRSDLRYLRLLHVDKEGRVRKGEMVCHRSISAKVVGIFKKLYQARYPIERIQLIDDYDADDELSMRANNTSAFCFRRVKGTRTLSAHARGLAVDVNPLYNPCRRRSRTGKVTVQPSNASRYCDRAASFPYKIVRGDLLHRQFLANGFRWGGAWRSVKDWQHFEL